MENVTFYLYDICKPIILFSDEAWISLTSVPILPAGLTVLLSSAAGLFLSNYNLPFPGHVLIYGPPVSSFLQIPVF